MDENDIDISDSVYYRKVDPTSDSRRHLKNTWDDHGLGRIPSVALESLLLSSSFKSTPGITNAYREVLCDAIKLRKIKEAQADKARQDMVTNQSKQSLQISEDMREIAKDMRNIAKDKNRIAVIAIVISIVSIVIASISAGLGYFKNVH